MDSKLPILIGAGVAIAAVTGISLAMMQASKTPSSPETTVIVTSTTAASPTVSPIIPSPIAVSPQPSQPTSQPAPIAPSPAATNPPAKKPSQPLTTSASVPASVQTEVCVTSTALIADPNPPLNVRSSPEATGDNVVGTVKNGTYVSVIVERNNWLQIGDPVAGWISKTQTKSGCNQKTARINFAPGTSSARVSDRFIGTGSHRYLFTATQGQTLTLTNSQGDLPAIEAPDGSLLNSSAKPGATSWTGKLPLTGEYTIRMESNYKGYDYEFSVQIR